MKNIINIVFLLMAYNSSVAQINYKSLFTRAGETNTLKVYCITEYIDSYIIKAVDTLKNDTINIVSTKITGPDVTGYIRIEVGNTYTFKYEDLTKKYGSDAT